MYNYEQNQKPHLLNIYHDRPSQHQKRVIFAFVSLFIIIFAIYGNTFQVPFHFDDYVHITHNKKLHITELTLENIKKTFTHYNSPHSIYRPVAYFSFALNYFFGRDNVTGYHLVNISIHLTSSFFLFLFIFNTLKLPAIKEKCDSNAYLISLLATVMWASNPVQTQAVTYIVQRMASMAGMFYIIAMYLYLKGRTSNRAYAQIIFFVLCSVAALLALGSKENALMLPLSLIFYDLMLIQSISKENIKKNLMFFLLCVLIVVGFGFIATYGKPLSPFAAYKIRPFSLTERVLTESRIIVFYISLLLYPMTARLNLTHDITISYSLFNPLSTIFSILFIGSIIAVALFLAKKRPLISFSLIFFFLNHIVESTILPLELIYEHRNYLPSMFFFVPFAVLFIKSLSYFAYKKSMQTIITVFTILVIVGQGHATYMRNYTWKSEGSLWLDAVSKSFYLSRPHMNLGKYYFDKGFIGKAILENKLAIKFNRYLNTGYRVTPHLNLIACYFKTNEFDKVIEHSTLAQKINPNISSTYDDMAAALIETGDLDAAYVNIKKSLSINKNNALAYNILGRILLEQGHFQSAVSELKKALNIDSNMTEAIINIALAYRQNKDYSESIRHFKMALLKDSNPQSFENIYANLGLLEVYALIGDRKALKKVSSNLVSSVDKERLLDMIANNSRSHLDTRILYSELKESYLSKGEDFFLKTEEISKLNPK
ncbi:MAG: hypothetical protein H8D96_18165 [Desulfobacterales bacterium]|uniref:Tetratricopeptide repeat protein n=1 Tax=Candidatus Desulfatibia vada TaxID=2841696 RepID=A0A8J6P2P2_9BACT|nr:hypothetical protein [Candidatus Desulfatibia vada]